MVKKELCIVHVGMHKTGSSSIQNMLFNHLEDKRFHYANLQTPNHSELKSLFADSPELYHGYVARGWNKEEITKKNNENRELLIKGFLSRDVNVTEIISGEDLGYLNLNELHRMKQFLNHYFENIQIIAYIRPPKAYLQSAFQELVKHGVSRLNLNECDPEYIRFKNFETVFGKQNIILKPFVKDRLYDNDVVKDFLNTLGIEQNLEYKDIKDNESISLEALKFLFAYQKFYTFPVGANIFRDRHRLIKELSKIGNKKLIFSPNILEPVLNKNADGIKYVEELMGISFNEKEENITEAIASENDLLEFSDDSIEELKFLIGQNHLDDNIVEKTPQGIANLVYVLVCKLGIIKKDKELKSLTTQQLQTYYQMIKDSGSFDEEYYVSNNSDLVSLREKGEDLLMHYMVYGEKENRKPNADFDPQWYRETYDDIVQSGMNLFAHYVWRGKEAGRLGKKDNIEDGIIVGDDGWLFLAGGTNNLLKYYNDADFFSDATCKQWKDLLCTRKERLTKMEIEYIHLFVPDKISVYPEHTLQTFRHFDAHPINKLFSSYFNDIEHFAINPIVSFKEAKEKNLLYWKTDSHWTFWGCYEAFNLLITQLKLDIPPRILDHNIVKQERQWDLGAKIKIKRTEISEVHSFAKTAQRVFANELIEYKEKNNKYGDVGLHIGSNVIFKNGSNDIVLKKVVIFGDSFSEYRPIFLTAMFAEMFAEVHFVWSTSIDYEYINRVKPDIVISEIAERFMNRVPDDTFVLSKYVEEKMASLA